MQATVRNFDAASGHGSVLLDTGLELRFPAQALDGSGVRLLRLGQRVRVRLDASGRHVAALTLATFQLDATDESGPAA